MPETAFPEGPVAAPAPAPDAPPVLEATGLVKRFRLKSGLFGAGAQEVQAVAGVSLTLARGETLGIVGESGCGKTTLGRLVMRLLTPDEGALRLNGRDVTRIEGADLRAARREMQMVFQDPYASLDPRMRCGDAVAEPMEVHGAARGPALEARVAGMFERVGLSREQMRRFPHQLSGGQRQRLGIARALALSPAAIVADEPVSALDVSVQAQVLNLMKDLQAEFGLAYLFISHDLAVVAHVAHRVAVMYLGKVVEEAPAAALFAGPLHPYSEALLASAPRPSPRPAGERRARAVLRGDVPSPVNPPSGCAFHTRCPLVRPLCREVAPPLLDAGGGRKVACHFRGPAASGAAAGAA